MIEITLEVGRTWIVRLGSLEIPAADRTDATILAKHLADAINLYSMTGAEVRRDAAVESEGSKLENS